MEYELYHYGVLGMKWGIRRPPQQSGGLSRKDARWARRNTDKVMSKAKKKSSRELSEYSKELLRQPGAVNKDGRLSSKTITAYNQKMAELMTKNVSSLKTPSGRAVKFVAKRGEIGVHMAITDEGYDMSQFKNGVYGSGKIAYRNKNANVAHV